MIDLPQRYECACVVPFFNERDRIRHVLDVVTTIPHLTQVICVDDGSTDGTTALVARRFPQVSLLLLPCNSGKAAAVQAAAAMVRTRARNTLKVQKQGPVRGLAGDVAMVKNMVDYAGVGGYLKQYMFFAREAGAFHSPDWQPRDFQSLADSTKRPQALETLPQPLRRLRRFSR
jgi:glycosyltransferase involved in cell wall biosynthesis